MLKNLQHTHTHTHTYTDNRFTALRILSGTTWVSRYQKKHSSTHTHRGRQSSLICIIHLPWHPPCFIHAPDSLTTIFLQVFFGLPIGLAPSTLCSIHFFTQSLSSFHNTCPYHCNLFHCSTEIMSSNHNLSTLHLEFCLVVSHHTAISPFSSLPAEVPPHFPFLRARSHFHATYGTTSHTTAVQSPSHFQ